MAPILEHDLGVRITVPRSLDTDQFGTFTRDIKRPGDQLHTARLKAEQAMSLTGATLAFASEGSFGAHPSIPFVSCNREIVVLIDRSHDLEIVGQAISTETNYHHQTVTSVELALAFAQKIGFPKHGLVAMPNAQPSQPAAIVKGITNETHLIETVSALLHQFEQAHLETDMRAMHNPTRMKVIAQATHDLIDRIQNSCPQCGWPDFALVDRKAGLPCALCHLPTQLTLAVTYHCKKCNFSRIVQFPDEREFADPAQCLYCNP